jgi:release factor glutamine methyltransferase
MLPDEQVWVTTSPNDVRGALSLGVSMLESSGVPSAGLTAELLLMHIVGRDRSWIYAHPEAALTPTQQSLYEYLVQQRIAGVPTQYLTGKQGFWGLEFEVTPDVLIPRPETELLMEVALARLEAQRFHPLRIADVGTGSGCIAVALAHELSNVRVLATDISASALRVARRNALRHKVAERIEFRQLDLLGGYAGWAGSKFDVIVSNPPYIGLDEAADLPLEVGEHEPREALFSGASGVEIYPKLIEQAREMLCEGGALLMEVGHRGADEVHSFLKAYEWRNVERIRDLAGIERVLSAERASSGDKHGQQECCFH